jgi:DNA recombination protein Rad52
MVESLHHNNSTMNDALINTHSNDPHHSTSNNADVAQIVTSSETLVRNRYAQSPAKPSVLTPTTNHPQFVLHPLDRSIVHDHLGNPLTVDRLLATKPLQSDLQSRPGPGNKRLTYLSGDGVTRSLNEIFGYDGWNMTLLQFTQVDRTHANNKYTVAYVAHVRITLAHGGTYREDCGAGDASDRSLAVAIQHAMKASITDAMKRAARQLGEKLGNSLYSSEFTIKNAPKTMVEALQECDERLLKKYGAPAMNKAAVSTVLPTATMHQPAGSSLLNQRQQQQTPMTVKSSNNTSLVNTCAIAKTTTYGSNTASSLGAHHQPANTTANSTVINNHSNTTNAPVVNTALVAKSAVGGTNAAPSSNTIPQQPPMTATSANNNTIGSHTANTLTPLNPNSLLVPSPTTTKSRTDTIAPPATKSNVSKSTTGTLYPTKSPAQPPNVQPPTPFNLQPMTFNLQNVPPTTSTLARPSTSHGTKRPAATILVLEQQPKKASFNPYASS